MELPNLAFPRPLGKLVSLLPSTPPSYAFVKMLNLALGNVIRKAYLEPLQGKLLVVHVKDIGLHLSFTVTPDEFRISRSGHTPDLVISATLRDFLLLASRKEDPDTLFFNRRLVVEGDTELGLVAKNTLDAIELPKFSPAMLAPHNLLSQMKSRLRHN
jgi:predicted lipid carrier protein YhbT